MTTVPWNLEKFVHIQVGLGVNGVADHLEDKATGQIIVINQDALIRKELDAHLYFEKEAIVRKRIFKSPIYLIKALIYYLCDNHSLLDIRQFILMSGIGKISDTAF